MIVPVGPTLSTPTAALLDTGSSHSFVSHKALPSLKSYELLNSDVRLSISKLNDSVEEIPAKHIRITLIHNNRTFKFEAFTVKIDLICTY